MLGNVQLAKRMKKEREEGAGGFFSGEKKRKRSTLFFFLVLPHPKGTPANFSLFPLPLSPFVSVAGSSRFENSFVSFPPEDALLLYYNITYSWRAQGTWSKA